MAAAWQPSPEGLAQLLGLFRSSTSATNDQHRQIQQQLVSFNSIPDYNNYLVYIVNHLREEDPNVRQMAGLVLKNNVKDHWLKLPPEVHAYVKENLIGSVGDPSPFIRSTVGSCVTTVVTAGAGAGGLEAWPELIPMLYQLLDSPDANQVEGAYGALHKICEDSADALALQPGQPALNTLIPKFLASFASPSEYVRKMALGCVNQFVQVMAEALASNLDTYLKGLFALAADPSPEVRKRVCQALVMLLDVHLDCLLPHMKQVIEYMLISTKDADELVALEACEFWSAICETRVAKEYLAEYLPRLVPVLLDGMVYTEFDLMMLGVDEDDDEHVADRPEDIKPKFHRAKVAGGGGGGGEGGGGSAEAGAAGAVEAGAHEDDDEDEDDEDEDVLEWNLRKCSASGLDILSGLFGRDVLPTLLPTLQAKLSAEKWEVRESAILALGAIAEGCMEHMTDYLPQLVPWLISTLSDTKPLIRSMTCWTLSRYAKWIVHTQPHEAYYQPLLQELLKRVLDTNKKVQEAACSAFATVEEEAAALLVPYLGPILQNLMFAFSKYQAKNLLILYDAIGTLADAVGSALCKPELVQMLMPPLIAKWNELADEDRGLFPLLECLTSIAQALGIGFYDYTEPVFARCLRLIEKNLKPSDPNAPEGEGPDGEFVVCALDLTSGLAEAIGASLEPLVANSTLIPLLYESMRAEQADIRQSAYALVGDLAKACPNALKPVVKDFMPLLLAQLNQELVSVCNNAAWAIGEIAVKVGSDVRPWVNDLIAQLVPIMTRPNLNKSLLENTAITIGRLGLVAPDLVAPLLDQFVQPWCSSLRNIRDDIEKEHAFTGLCEMIKLNPRGVINQFAHLCDAIASWQNPPAELNEMFRQILVGYKSSVAADAWVQYYGTFPEYMRTRLTERYQI